MLLQVTDLKSFGYLMRSNSNGCMLTFLLYCHCSQLISDYKQDPYSDKNPTKAICSRGDLSHQPYAGGCIDTKVKWRCEYSKLTLWVRSSFIDDGLQ